MAPPSETELLRYRDQADDQAFAAFVTQRTDLVWSVALRRLEGDRALAEEVVQTVFADVVRKIRHLDLQQPLTGWLVKHTLLKAAEAARRERRHRERDHRYSVMNPTDQAAPPEELSTETATLVDGLLQSLPAADRQALLLRFYEKHDLAEVARRLGGTPEAARKRIGRALELVRAKLARRGITSSATLLSGALMSGAVQAAPAGLAVRAASFGLTQGVAPLGLMLGVKLAALHALRESRWLPALATGAVVAVSAPLWHHPPPPSLPTPAAAAIFPPAAVNAAARPASAPPGAAPGRAAVRPLPAGSARPSPETLFAELSRLLDSPLGTVATDRARREFVGRWKEFLALDAAEEQSLDAWLATAFKDAKGDARRILNDPELMQLALDKAAGKPVALSDADLARLESELAALPSQQPRTPWPDEHLDPARRERLRVRQLELRAAAAEAAASRAVADLDRSVPLREDQKNAVFQYQQALALSRPELIDEEQLGFLAPPSPLPAAPAGDEDGFLAGVLDPAQQELRDQAKAREALENQRTFEGLRLSH